MDHFETEEQKEILQRRERRNSPYKWPDQHPSVQFQAGFFPGPPMPKAQQLNITHQIYHCVLTKKEACCSNIAIRNGCCSHTDHKVDDKTAITLLLTEQLDYHAFQNHHINSKNSAVQSFVCCNHHTVSAKREQQTLASQQAHNNWCMSVQQDEICQLKKQNKQTKNTKKET